MYAGAVGRYTLFLTSAELVADPSERRTALHRAREHGLDVPPVAIVTVEHTIERALDGSRRLKGQLLDLVKAAQEPDTTRTVLREQGVRDGAGTGEDYTKIPAWSRRRVDVARCLLDTLSAELAAISWPERRVAMYLDYHRPFI
ncbi:hypothetical protein BJY52DRAFT_1279778, partial [Lactarius psammicola]